MSYINKSKTDDWTTPPELLQEIKEEFGEFFDPCPIDYKENGLLIEWKAVNFVNPPYSDLKYWAWKCAKEFLKGKTVILLCPARTDTKAFHSFIKPFAEIRFIKGRLKFGGCKNPAPFPSILAIYRGIDYFEVVARDKNPLPLTSYKNY